MFGQVVKGAVFCTLLHIAAITGAAAQSVDKSETPEWADLKKVPPRTQYQQAENTGGISYLLHDIQTRWAPGGYEQVTHLAYAVDNRAGLEGASRIAPAYEPEDTSLSFNFIRVTRGDTTQDRLADAQIETLRQEAELYAGIINGAETALIELQDIKVGDIIEYAYTIRKEEQLWPDDFFGNFAVEWSDPIAHQYFSVTVPRGEDIKFKAIETDLTIDRRRKGAFDVYSFSQKNPPVVKPVTYIPSDKANFGFFSVSTMQSWEEVSGWAANLYDIDYALPDQFLQKVSAIRSEHPSASEQAVAALHLIQNEIRYLGIENGLGSHKPRTPAETLSNGYGDCKDKSVLLIAALNALGIDAYPVLASTASGFLIDQLLPSITAFNHVIVVAKIDGRQIWMDPTITYQGGRADTLSPLDYGWTLPIKDGQAELVLAPVDLPDTPSLSVSETYSFWEEGDTALTIAASIDYRHWEADGMRRRVAQEGADDLSESFFSYYRDSHSGLRQSKEISISDRPEENIVTISAEYELDRETFNALGYETNISLYASTVWNVLPSSLEADRVTDLALPYGSNIEHILKMHTPGRQIGFPADEAKSAFGAVYNVEFSRFDDTLTAKYNLKVDQRNAPLSSADGVIQLADHIAKNAGIFVNISLAQPSLSRTLGQDEEIDPGVLAELEDAIRLVNANKSVPALRLLNQLEKSVTEKTRLRGYIQTLRGAVLVDLRRHAAAFAALDEGFTLYEPEAPYLYVQFAGMLTAEQKNIDAAKILTRMLMKHPTSLPELNSSWLDQFAGMLYQVRTDEALNAAEDLVIAVAESQHNTGTPETIHEWYYIQAVQALTERGEKGRAATLLQYIHSPSAIASYLADKDLSPIWTALEARIGKGFEKALLRNIEESKSAVEADPENWDKKIAYFHGLLIAGSVDEALEYAKPIVDNHAMVDAVGERAFYFVGNYANGLASLGRYDEAIKTLDRILSLGIESHPELINVAINKAGLLLNIGRFDDALADADELMASYSDQYNDYGAMWLLSTRACALHQLGNTAKANAFLNGGMAMIAEQNPEAHTKALICLGREDDAETLIIKRLGDRHAQTTALMAFVESAPPTHEHEFFSDLQQRAEQIRSRRSVQRELKKHGRAVSVNSPQNLWGAHF